MTRRAAVSDAQFWDLVKQIGWGTQTTDYKAIKQSLMSVLSKEEAASFFKVFHKVQGALMKAITKWEDETGENLEVGDDGFNDLTAHIIGLGKPMYDKVIRVPDLAKNIKYVESFAYGIPYSTDYDREGTGRFKTWALKVIPELESYAEADAFRPMAADARKLIGYLQLIVKGDTQSFLDTEGEAKGLAEKLEGFYNKLMETEVFHNKWSVWNLYSDLRQELGKDNHLKLRFAGKTASRTAPKP